MIISIINHYSNVENIKKYTNQTLSTKTNPKITSFIVFFYFFTYKIKFITEGLRKKTLQRITNIVYLKDWIKQKYVKNS